MTTGARIGFLLGATKRVRRVDLGLVDVSYLVTELGPADGAVHSGQGDVGGTAR